MFDIATPIFVFVAFVYNATVAAFGMNATTKVKISIIGVGVLLGIAATALSIIQSIGSNKTSSEFAETSNLIRLIAINDGIDPHQTPRSLTRKIIKKQLGNEAIALSDEIMKFLEGNREASNNPDMRNDLAKMQTIVGEYQRKYSARVLSLADRINNDHPASIDQQQYFMMQEANNTMVIREAAQDLGRVGNTLLHEASDASGH